ncbi:MAG: 7-dehydrocholesterol reductase [Verrucomicrobia bacterium]|nr:7-dehydrocholesterol reductase [Verrucomicrobiota bacterium]
MNILRVLERMARFLLLIILCPCIVLMVWYANAFLDGSSAHLFALFEREGFLSTVYQIWSPLFFGSAEAWLIIAVFFAVEFTLMKVLPGKKIQGHSFTYKANGISSLVTTIALFFLSAFFISPTLIYDHFGELLGALNFLSLLVCLFLFAKGVFKPSTKRHGGEVRVFKYCRCGVMAWALIILSFAAKQYTLHGLSNAMIVSVALQMLYIIKFFWWESGYLRSMGLTYDRSGYCIFWGCLVWLPGIYTSPTLYLVNHPYTFSTWAALSIFLAGATCIFINYLADRQRHHVRLTHGDCTVWNRQPELIFANYKTEWGHEKESVLLASGWWGISRHFHYLPEFVGALCWSVPALFNHFLPYFYLSFLLFLLIDRAYKQEKRCATKYGENWNKYCERVPFRFIPFVY